MNYNVSGRKGGGDSNCELSGRKEGDSNCELSGRKEGDRATANLCVEGQCFKYSSYKYTMFDFYQLHM